MGGMRPSEIRSLKETFLRTLVFSMLLAILTNVLSLFWVIGGEAWFENSYLYSSPPPHNSDGKTSKIQIDTSISKMEASFYAPAQQAYEKLEANGSTHIENVFQYIAQDIKELFQLITVIFS
ncbi:MAG: hypothetical protein FGF52_02685 [Candidatus Brockarchaeota archaeon]|nr:hypothetical protein [Candidatus Brockarchaeota archaeon]